MKMISIEISAVFVAILIILPLSGIHCDNKPCLVGSANDITERSVSKKLQNLRTNELISFYGYLSEVHHVTTPKGYKLTMFRCNSKKFPLKNKRVAVFFHGFVSSSDDVTMNMPGQGLAYVLADAGYDVWLSNDRGNFYSCENLYMDPDDPASGFWDFSWDDIALEDYPAIFKYIRKITCQPKMYVIAHSKGTSSMMALLSERPECNSQIHALSLMAPIGYLKNSALLNDTVDGIMKQFQGCYPQVVYPREQHCTGNAASFCAAISNVGLTQKNNTMMKTYFSHFPSGSSTAEVSHYQREVKLGYFGRRMTRSDFPLYRITVPISVHYAVSDSLAVPKDVEKTLSKFVGTKNLYVQKIGGKFNHQDFIWGTNASDIVYSQILQFFRKF